MIEQEGRAAYGGMRAGVIASVIAHSALLASVLFTIHSHQPPRVPEPEPLAVDLVTPGDVTKLRKGSRTAKQLEAQAKETPKSEVSKKEADKPKPVPANTPPPPPPPPEPEKAEPKSDPIADKIASAPPTPAPEPPPPGPGPAEKKKLEDIMKKEEEERKAEEQRKAEDKRKADAKKAAEKKKEEARQKRLADLKKKKEEEKRRKEAEAKKKNFSDEMAALLNKIPDKGAPPPPSEHVAPNAKKGPALGAPEGRDKQLTASELAILGQIIKSCVQSKWTVMAGGEDAQSTQVKVRLRFNPDGRLATAPTIVNPQSTPLFLAVSDSALRAVQACEPFPLPADKYEIWKDIILNFDPRDMYR